MKNKFLTTLCVTAALGAGLFCNQASAGFAGSKSDESGEFETDRASLTNLTWVATGPSTARTLVHATRVTGVTRGAVTNFGITGLAWHPTAVLADTFGAAPVFESNVSIFTRNCTLTRDGQAADEIINIDPTTGERAITAYDETSKYWGVIDGTNYSPSTGRGAGSSGSTGSAAIIANKGHACLALMDVCAKTSGGWNRTTTTEAVDVCDESSSGYYTLNDVVVGSCSGAGCVSHITCTQWCANTSKNKHCSTLAAGDCVAKCRASNETGNYCSEDLSGTGSPCY